MQGAQSPNMGDPNPLNMVAESGPPGLRRDVTGGAQNAAGNVDWRSTGGFHFIGSPASRNRDGRATSDRGGRRGKRADRRAGLLRGDQEAQRGNHLVLQA